MRLTRFRYRSIPAQGLRAVPGPVTWVPPEVFAELAAFLNKPPPPSLAEAVARLRTLRDPRRPARGPGDG